MRLRDLVSESEDSPVATVTHDDLADAADKLTKITKHVEQLPGDTKPVLDALRTLGASYRAERMARRSAPG